MAFEIVGISGTSASGKDTAAEHLEDRGYLLVATGQVVRGEAMRLFGSTDQYLLRKAGHELRQRLGGGAICIAAIEQYQEKQENYKGVVVSGIKALAPAQTIKDLGGLLVFVDAPTEVRYQRQVGRARIGESSSYEEFVRFEEEEFSGQLATGQNARGIQEISDVIINNVHDLPTFIADVDRAVGI